LRTAYLTGSWCNNRGSLALYQEVISRRDIEEVIQQCCECEVADESVVVLKFQPMKPGNSVEDKTGMTFDDVQRACIAQKALAGAKGGSNL